MQRILVSLCLLVFLCAAPALAAPITYADRSVWLNSTSGLTTLDFSEFTGTANNSLGGSYTSGDVTFTAPVTAPASGLYSMGNLVSFDAAYLTTPYLLWQAPAPQSPDMSVITITFVQPITAVGFDFGTLFGGVDPFQIAIAGGPSYTVNNAASAFAFFGFTADTPFTSLTIATAPHAGGVGAFPLIDNLSFGSFAEPVEAAPAPEPGTLTLAGSALALVYARQRRRAKRQRD